MLRSKLTPREVNRLWGRFKNQGDEKARKSLIEHYDYLVFKTSRRRLPNPPPNIEFDDIVQEARKGLIKAIDTFESWRDVKFETYAIHKINHAISDYLRKDDWVPRTVREKRRLLQSVEDNVLLSNGAGGIDPAEMARSLNLSQDDYERLCREACVYEVI